MARLTILLCVGALLAVAAPARAAEIDPVKAAPGSTGGAGPLAPAGANAAACADANSDYERYEFGCPLDVPGRLVLSSESPED